MNPDEIVFDKILNALANGDYDAANKLMGQFDVSNLPPMPSKREAEAMLRAHKVKYSLNCPECGSKIILKARRIPGGSFGCTCQSCNTISGFRDDTAGKYSRAKSRRLEESILDIFFEQAPRLTVRQIFYALTVRYAVPKSESGYRQAQNALRRMRLSGQLPYGWIADNTRRYIKPRTFDNLADALFRTQELYRRNLWQNSPYYIEIWVEKDALSGVMSPITSEYDVPLYVARGYSSLTFVYEAAEEIKACGKEAYIYHFGDFDAAGVLAANKIRDGLRGHGADIHFIRAGVTEEQIAKYNLPTRTQKKDKAAQALRWGSKPCAELDAIPPNTLRQLVRECIEKHIDRGELERLKTIEEQEKKTLATIRANFVPVQNVGGPA